MNRKKLRSIVLLFLFLIASGIIFYITKTSADISANRLWEQGIELYNQDKYQDAYYNFKKIKPVASLYQLALIKQYRCAIMLADKKTAYIKMQELAKKTRDANVRPWALYSEANLALELNYATKGKSYQKFKHINEAYPENDFGVASAYKMAKLAQTKNVKMSKKKYLEYLNYAPSGKFAIYALDNLNSIKLPFSEADYEIIAKANLINLRYKEALIAYKKTDWKKNWFNISKCYKGLGNTVLEKNTISKALELTEDDIDEKQLDEAIERLFVIQNVSNKSATYKSMAEKYKNTKAYPTIIYKLAETLSGEESIKYYKLVKNNYPSSIWASNSLWEVFKYNYKLNNLETCQDLALDHAKIYSKTQDAPRVMYWMAKLYTKNHKTRQAKDLHNKIINNYPLSYYAFLSAKQLKISKSKKSLVKKPIVTYDINSLNKYLFKDKITSELAKRNDFETIEELKLDNEFIKSRIAYSKKYYPTSINLAKEEINKELNISEDNEDSEKIDFSNYKLKLSYPVLYEKEINKYARLQKQSPYLFLSLVREESHFDRKAQSPAGAVGLSQIMPDTARFIEKTEVTKRTLQEEDDNIRIGLKYFKYLVDYYNGNEYLAILAYNAGPGSVDKWIIDLYKTQDADIELMIEDIPFLETKNYIKKILSSYWIYLNIYSPQNK